MRSGHGLLLEPVAVLDDFRRSDAVQAAHCRITTCFAQGNSGTGYDERPILSRTQAAKSGSVGVGAFVESSISPPSTNARKALRTEPEPRMPWRLWYARECSSAVGSLQRAT